MPLIDGLDPYTPNTPEPGVTVFDDKQLAGENAATLAIHPDACPAPSLVKWNSACGPSTNGSGSGDVLLPHRYATKGLLTLCDATAVAASAFASSTLRTSKTHPGAFSISSHVNQANKRRVGGAVRFQTQSRSFV